MAMRESNIMHLGMTIINILNCLFGKKSHLAYLEEDLLKNDFDPESNQEKELKKKKKKKGNNAKETIGNNEIAEK